MFKRLSTHLALILICTGYLIPLAWMLSTSLKNLDETMQTPPALIPQSVKNAVSMIDAKTGSIKSLETKGKEVKALGRNYIRTWNHPRIDFPLYTRNTLLVCTLACLGTLVSSSLVAYGFARIEFKGRGLLFTIMLSTMMIPFPVLMVSLFRIYRWVGDHTPIQMLGTFKPLWLPWWFGSAFNIFLLRQFFMTIPKELSDAARIDGCSEFGIFFRVMLPLTRPALTVIALFTFMNCWNDFVGPLVFLNNPDDYTLALGLQTFQSQHGGTEWHYLMAASTLVILPVLVLFFLTQRTFIQGIATTGLKG